MNKTFFLYMPFFCVGELPSAPKTMGTLYFALQLLTSVLECTLRSLLSSSLLQSSLFFVVIHTLTLSSPTPQALRKTTHVPPPTTINCDVRLQKTSIPFPSLCPWPSHWQGHSNDVVYGLSLTCHAVIPGCKRSVKLRRKIMGNAGFT